MESDLIFTISRENSALNLIQKALKNASNRNIPLHWWQIEAGLALKNYHISRNYSVILSPAQFRAEAEKQPLWGVVMVDIPDNGIFTDIHKKIQEWVQEETNISFFEARKTIWNECGQKFWLDLSIRPEPGTKVAQLSLYQELVR